MAEDQVTFEFTINGTDTNPYAQWGLRQNPFPLLSSSDLGLAFLGGQRALLSLGGEPIRSADDIRSRLPGFDPEFVDGVIARWTPGEIVRVKLTWPRHQEEGDGLCYRCRKHRGELLHWCIRLNCNCPCEKGGRRRAAPEGA